MNVYQLGSGQTLILGSSSPRRQELLRAFGIPFEIVVSDVNEDIAAGEGPRAMVERLAADKAVAVSRMRPAAWVIGADTTVSIDGMILAKPSDRADAREMLHRLKGRTHEVLSGVALAWDGACDVVFSKTTLVSMRAMSDVEIDNYVASGEPMGKAGAYAVQGIASQFVTRVEGSYTNIVGFDSAALADELLKRGIIIPS